MRMIGERNLRLKGNAVRVSARVRWRTESRQGPNYEPFETVEVIYSPRAITHREIAKLIREQYGAFIDSVEIESVATEGDRITG